MTADSCLLEHTLIMGGDETDAGATYQGWPANDFTKDRVILERTQTTLDEKKLGEKFEPMTETQGGGLNTWSGLGVVRRIWSYGPIGKYQRLDNTSDIMEL